MTKKTVLDDVFGENHELEAVLKQIKKQYGDGAVMMLGESPTMEIEAIPSGSLSLDCALGIGGYPKGRIVEIYGPESSGKTTLAIHAVAEAQKLGLLAAYIDAEHAFDREYAANLGVNVNKLLLENYNNFGLNELEFVILLKLFEMLKNNQVTISVSQLSKKTSLSVHECSNVLNSLFNRGLLTIDLETNNLYSYGLNIEDKHC